MTMNDKDVDVREDTEDTVVISQVTPILIELLKYLLAMRSVHTSCTSNKCTTTIVTSQLLHCCLYITTLWH